ncbi:hypothetical protein Acj9p005 [Acinetobacter phage Acj9]|uniref:Uncharacterized protein n=1 Tax=Acinetobacter phage Acj9 TaxID=760939 RepID=E5EPD9_9CAUD|nr:hypothetical protein Acj9p005 [Acinetobacter phage Acj9]ADG59905.1 hypothetical protein Acj9p005 [Acinetobacter phage Acj9]
MVQHIIEFDEKGTMFYRGYQIDIETKDVGTYQTSIVPCWSSWRSPSEGFLSYEDTDFQSVLKRIDSKLHEESSH